MKYTAQFIFPSLGKIDRCIALDDLRDKIEVPLIEHYISSKPLDLGEASRCRFKRMEFIFNGHQTPQNFKSDGKGNWFPTNILCEYEFNGIRE